MYNCCQIKHSFPDLPCQHLALNMCSSQSGGHFLNSKYLMHSAQTLFSCLDLRLIQSHPFVFRTKLWPLSLVQIWNHLAEFQVMQVLKIGNSCDPKDKAMFSTLQLINPNPVDPIKEHLWLLPSKKKKPRALCLFDVSQLPLIWMYCVVGCRFQQQNVHISKSSSYHHALMPGLHWEHHHPKPASCTYLAIPPFLSLLMIILHAD